MQRANYLHRYIQQGIMFLKLNQGCKKNVDEYPFSDIDSQAYQQLKSLLIQLYERKENLNPKSSFLERRQLEHENVHLFATQFRILSKKAFPGIRRGREHNYQNKHANQANQHGIERSNSISPKKH
ncbi:hypothetical protein BpHYR1_029405 [Brachionus plicatilis]|uniref:Retrotransposon gag domain-containing protein n=1 Tax=Brachionus plicatilis TaxID=10195 RepID=A0A3M7Q8X8_BRAPC|nr:hypothetical protein BpHYR1_029405 [Brachionus plicatilis]